MVTTATKGMLQSIIDLHNKMKGAYFYSPPQQAYARRRYEEHNSMSTEFVLDGEEILVEQITSCSCKNVYYSMSIYIDGKITDKNIRFIKNILKELDKAA